MPLSLPTLTAAPSPLERELRQAVQGEVHSDITARGLYAQDASHYQTFPRLVLIPRTSADVVTALEICRRHRVAVTARGGGTSLSGQTFGPGLVIDVSKHLNGVLEVNAAEGWARVQPGVVRDQLNAQLKPLGLHFAPDPATGRVATVGGMIGNNSSGTRSIVYGKTLDSVIALRVALMDGTVMDLRPTDRDGWRSIESHGGREGELYRNVRELIEAHADEIRAKFPRVMRRVSGYNLDCFVEGAGYTGPIGRQRPPGEWNLADLIVGSEGTLAVLLEATVRLHPLPKATALCIVHFDDLIESLRAVPAMLEHSPSAIELLDRVVIAEAAVNPATQHKAVALWPDVRGAEDHAVLPIGEGTHPPHDEAVTQAAELANLRAVPRRVPAAMQIVEFFGDTPAEANDRAAGFAHAMRQRNIGTLHVLRADAAAIADVWDTRKLGLGLISNVPGRTKGIEFVEDACVPVEHLADYISKLTGLCDEMGLKYAVYAHASVGVLHVRPMINAHTDEGRAMMRRIAEQAFTWVSDYGGTVSGEHGDGMVRGEFVPKAFGPKIYEAFRQIKQWFDPDGLLNPGKIVDTRRMDDPHVHRYGDAYHPVDPPVLFRHNAQGGFVQAVEQCNGVGACRKIGDGTMCPSYMATRDESATTRGRANVMRLAMSGQLGQEPLAALAGDEMHSVLELCLSCKACKQECPNAVDMAKLKADVTQLRHDQHGTPLGARLVGGMPDIARRLHGPLAWAFNLPPKLPGARWLMEKVAGIDRRRPLPRLSSRRFKRPTPSGNGEPVVLFLDTFAGCFEPHIAEAATTLLTTAGFDVHIADVGCCQRTRLSKGLVREAKSRGEQTLRNLDALLPTAPILCLEPSCASALADDLPDLVDDIQLGQRIAARVKLVEAFLAERGVPVQSTAGELLLHGHCHQKALFGTRPLHDLLGNQVREINSGCCGMAGSFGYEHHEVSGIIGADRLFPAVRTGVANGQTVIAPGISCRHQLHDWLGITARHPVEVLKVKPPEHSFIPARQGINTAS